MNKFKDKVLALYPNIADVVSYTNAKTTAVVTCHSGHSWQVVPSNLISKGSAKECPVCTNKSNYVLEDGVYKFVKTKTTATFKQELFSINPEVSLISEYTGAHNKVTLQCIHGHTWTIIPTNLLERTAEASCPTCTDKRSQGKLTHEEAEARIKSNYNNLTLVEYINSSSECIVTDSNCGHTFSTWFTNLNQSKGYRCKTCVPEYARSKNELELLNEIKRSYDGWIIENDRTLIKPKELDIVIPDLGLAIEYNSPYTHEDKDHLVKTTLTQEQGFKLIQVNEDEWVHKRDIVMSRIRNMLGKSYSLGARQCTVREIQFPRQFLDSNHIQGAGSPTSHNLGLFLQDELVAVMTFSKPRFTDKYTWELVRYCSLLDVTVTGGASRLLHFFIKHNQGSILSYSDKRWSEGNLYKQLNFAYSHTSQPSYAYYKNGKKLSRYQCQKHKLEELLPQHYNEDSTEAEIMKAAGYIRMYDCGTDVWVYNV